MARPPKSKQEKAPAVVPIPATVLPAAVAPRVHIIDSENFIRVRDSTVNRLQTMQALIGRLHEDYVRQTNLLLGYADPGEVPGADALASLDANFNVFPPVPLGVAIVPQVEEKKERKKRTHDPNAPKRPLTPYFLYMQTARPIIANDLGSEAPKGAVQEEGQRRWGAMGPSEKAGWNQAYQYNLRLYNARVHSYKHGNPEAKNMTDEEALKYAIENNIPMPNEEAGNDQAAIAEQLQGTSADAHGEVEELPPVAAKKGAGSRKRKTADAAEVAESSKAPATPASPDKKRRRSTKATEEKEEPKKSGRKKAAKSG